MSVPDSLPSARLPWWMTGVIYQIYPRSFQDSNADGVGDLDGVLHRLPWLEALGVDAIWLSPIQPGPQKDFGYDISDYCAIDPRFGDLASFDRLVAAAHAAGIRVVMDLVVNHSSDQHRWFQESRRDPHNVRKDWYIWAEGERPPNNWQSVFGGPAWTRDEKRGDWYLHSFLPEQPDLNWRNPDVEASVHDIMRFWLRRGVSGFRLDVYNCYLKDADLRDNPRTWNPLGLFYGYLGQRHLHDRDQPELVDVLRRMRGVVEEVEGGFLVGETLGEFDYAMAGRYSGPEALHLAFHFALLRAPWRARALHAAIRAQIEVLGPEAWPTLVLSNHDFPRLAARVRRAVGEDRQEAQLAVAAALLLTQRGTPFLYYGDEIGLPEVSVPRARLQDPVGRRFWPFHKGRDGCRTPMAWTELPGAGFSIVEPWLPLHADARVRNAAVQAVDPRSLANCYKRLIALRRRVAALHRGSLELGPADDAVLSWARAHGDERVEVRLNLSARKRALSLPPGAWEVLFSNQRPEGERLSPDGVLLPDEALVLGLV